jgi:hypothetical protein
MGKGQDAGRQFIQRLQPEIVTDGGIYSENEVKKRKGQNKSSGLICKNETSPALRHDQMRAATSRFCRRTMLRRRRDVRYTRKRVLRAETEI